MVKSKELSHADVAETKGRKVCLESTAVLVDMATSVSKVEKPSEVELDMES